MFAAREPPHEQRDFLIAIFNVSAHFVAVVAAANFDRLEPGALHILKDKVLVIVLAFDFEFDFHDVAALQCVEVFKFRPFELFNLLINDLSASTGHLRLFVDSFQQVVAPVDLDFESGLRDEVFECEVRQVSVEVDRAFA